MKQAKVFISNTLAGILTEDEAGYEFMYLPEYLASDSAISNYGGTFGLNDWFGGVLRIEYLCSRFQQKNVIYEFSRCCKDF